MSRWYLYYRDLDGQTYMSEEDEPDNFWWRCVAAGTEDACEAAARLMAP